MRAGVLCAAALLTLWAGTALAGPHDVAIHVTRLGGDTATAQPYLDRFLRTMESAIGWPASSMAGKFLTSRKATTAYLAEAKPGLAMLEPPLYFELRQRLQLRPVLQVESAELVTPRLHVVVKDPALKTLADLAGKQVCSTLGEYPRYLTTVVLGGQVDVARAWKLKPVRQALKGVRGVLRGECDATTLDDAQLSKAREMTGGKELRAIHDSPPLPPIPVVVFGDGLPAAEREALVKGLLAMCTTAQGQAICAEMHVGRFVAVDAAVFGDAEKKYGD